ADGCGYGALGALARHRWALARCGRLGESELLRAERQRPDEGEMGWCGGRESRPGPRKRPTRRVPSPARANLGVQRTKGPSRHGEPIDWAVFVGTNPSVPAQPPTLPSMGR